MKPKPKPKNAGLGLMILKGVFQAGVYVFFSFYVLFET